MNEEKTLECQLFTWEGWDQFDTMGFNFTGVTLEKDLGPFKAGEMFAFANIDYGKSTLELGKEFHSEKVYVFSLNLTATFTGENSI